MFPFFHVQNCHVIQQSNRSLTDETNTLCENRYSLTEKASSQRIL